MKRTAELKLHQPLANFATRLHVRNDLHLARKAWHMLMGMVMAFVFLAGLSVATSLSILLPILAFTLFVETVRLKNPLFNEKCIKLWGPLMRSSEINRMSGVPHYLAATVIAIGIFPKPVAVLSILYLACGDPIASLFGILFGDRGPRFASGKSLIGSAAGVATCAVVTFVFMSAMGVASETLLALTVIGGLAGGTAELMPFDADDNFTIPVISGFVLWLAFIIFGI